MVRRSPVPKKKSVNPRVGVKKSDYLMQVSFRKADNRLVSDIQKMYRERWFTQKQLSEMFELSPSLIGKIVRCDPFWRK